MPFTKEKPKFVKRKTFPLLSALNINVLSGAAAPTSKENY
jgi:hypothetical protein